MIEKITNQNQIARHKLAEKINELIEVINAITIDVDGTKCVDGSKKAYNPMIGCTMLDIPKSYIKTCRMDKEFAEEEMERLQKENSDLKDKIQLLQKKIDYAIDVIKHVAKMSDKLEKKYGDTVLEQLDNIQAYCWEQGYILTHDKINNIDKGE